MSAHNESDVLLVERASQGDANAWRELIARFEGRLLAYVESRLGDRATSEDLVQETFLGFLTSLPNYDRRRPLESYLFSIAAHKLTDQLRRTGRRPTLSLDLTESQSSGSGDEPASLLPRASQVVRSAERRGLEAEALLEALRGIVEPWQASGQWQKLIVVERLFVRGLANKEVARLSNLSEQQVANLKSDLLSRLRGALVRQGLSPDVFPELAGEVS